VIARGSGADAQLTPSLSGQDARLSERPSPSEIRRILRTYRDQIDAVVTRRRD